MTSQARRQRGFLDRLRRRLADEGEDGNAIIEFVFVAIVMLVPLIYFVVAVATIQHNQLAVSQAARDAGRAYATSESQSEADARARAAMAISLDAQHVTTKVTLKYVHAGEDCTASSAITPTLTPGTEFTVCVISAITVPGVPTILAGSGIASVGAYIVHVDDYRTVRP